MDQNILQYIDPGINVSGQNILLYIDPGINV